ncbi:MAG: hypothetical protein KGR26_09785, partial [Cyanobacteria bacterium REEB65]|nr:hypothetical protein [Cyanobacteria bacterium REEB65]
MGSSYVRDARMEMLLRRVRWAIVLANSPGLVGTVHRHLATLGQGGEWVEPSAALRAALGTLGWQLVRNRATPRAVAWPQLEREMAYPGVVELQPQLGVEPPPLSAWTDGSVQGSAGGAALVQPGTGARVQLRVGEPRSSTQCELVALGLVAQLAATPSLVLTDSLCALQLVKGWGRRCVRAVLACWERVAVRAFLAGWAGAPSPPVLEKVKAHDREGVLAGDARAVGNDLVDALAKQAVFGTAGVWQPDPQFEDAVRVQVVESGEWVQEAEAAVVEAWWEQREERRVTGRLPQRVWLQQLYPRGMPLDRRASCGVLAAPVVAGLEPDRKFVHAVPPAVVKWVARVRAGALATRGRLAKRMFRPRPGRPVVSPLCVCCQLGVEETDVHAVSV